MDLVEGRVGEPVVASLVQGQARVDDAGSPFDRQDDILCARHLGDARGVDETHRLDAGDAGRRQSVDELCPYGGLEYESVGSAGRLVARRRRS